ncbi:hypothetical protein ZIOFF_016410 [Zingiber officinale]|uniref:Uncharacterized protein n=1 Tax=Zingiber officinale TaxID=94328 RepID=A0A8J5LXA1_ZINOF|nr:hypothetical protein ZIOFF_016410 [Zingiber officinale]
MVACELPHLPSIDACAKFDVGAAARHGGPTSPPTASTIDKSIKDAFTGKASDTKSTDKMGLIAVFSGCVMRPLSISGLLTDCVFTTIGASANRLERLSVGCGGDGDAGLHYILSGCRKLCVLEIRKCPFGIKALLDNPDKLETMQCLMSYACGRYPQLPAPRVASKPAFEEGWAPHLAFEASGILGFILVNLDVGFQSCMDFGRLLRQIQLETIAKVVRRLAGEFFDGLESIGFARDTKTMNYYSMPFAKRRKLKWLEEHFQHSSLPLLPRLILSIFSFMLFEKPYYSLQTHF